MVSTRRFLLSALAGAVTIVSAASLSAQGAGATICRDGTRSVSSGRGACSGHGGIKVVAHHRQIVRHETGASTRASLPTPRASVRAQTRANANSAVVRAGVAEDRNSAGAIARCKDGLYSHATNRRGACSRHGGVAKWL